MHLKQKIKPRLSKYLRLVIYSYLPTEDYIGAISRLSRDERESVMDSAIASENRHIEILVPSGMCLIENGNAVNVNRHKLVEMVN